MEYLSVYDQTGALLAVLDSADKVGYQLTHNDLWTASFSLPAGDPKNAFCQAHNWVKLPDSGRATGLYRIVGMPSSDESGLLGVKTYNLEHVMATMLDDILFGYHEIGGTGIYTEDVIAYILSHQAVGRWQLGTCDFHDQFQYHFENVSVLSALLSLGEVIAGEYTWVFDTDSEPWTVSLLRADSTPGCGIHYGRNLVGVTKSMDATTLVTRLYPLGYGEGVNQLTIREANSGSPYLTADTAATWGVKCSVWTDTRIQDARTLKARAQAILEQYKNPYISYTAKAVDLYRLTGYSWDNFMPGKLVKVMDSEHGIDFNARIVSISKRDVNGDPGAIEITIANAVRDAADSINTLADRVGIGELYSQGATNLFAIPFADNADQSHPAKFRVYIPSGMVRINQMLLSWSITAFRAYSTSAAAGGSTTQTSSAGGASTQTSSFKETVTLTDEYGGDCVVSSATRVVDSDVDTGNIGWTQGPRDNVDGNVMTRTGSESLTTNGGGSHSHVVDSHRHDIGHGHAVDFDGYTVTVYDHGGYSGYSNPNTDTEANHTHTIGAHSHGMDHFHRLKSFTIPPLSIEVPGHTHNVRIPGHDHTVQIPEHTHSVTLPDHTHGIVYGIYEGGRAQSVTIYVDNTQVPWWELSSNEIDVVQWLAKDENGKITRGTWHEIRIVPDSLTRIEANLTAQVFVQSVGGGDY